MAREIWITHRTAYEFDESIDGAVIRARLRPPDGPAQTVVESDVHCRPRAAASSRVGDALGAGINRLVFHGPLRHIEITGQSRLLWRPSAAGAAGAARPEAAPTGPSWARPGGRIWRWARQALPDDTPGQDAIDAFMDLIRSDFTFDPRATDGSTAVPRFFGLRRGVCQDYAALAAGCLRARGVPVQLVFGYLIREPDGGHRFEEGQPHAWLSTWDQAAGWRDVDPTTGLRPPGHHITLRRGRGLRDIQPIAGRVRGRPVGQRLTVHVTVVKDAGPS